MPSTGAIIYGRKGAEAVPATGCPSPAAMTISRTRITRREENLASGLSPEVAIELDRFKTDMQRLSQRTKGLEKQQEEMQFRMVQEESGQSALEHLERFCSKVSAGLGLLAFEERQKLLRLVIERVIVKETSVRVETVIPSDGHHSSLLSTRHPELDSGSRRSTKYLYA
ncbi:MAG: hypothetical protein HOE50_06665 [Chloroflexi bacterium]|nr:hypothetical protein [Chloroflexota bacterium]